MGRSVPARGETDMRRRRSPRALLTGVCLWMLLPVSGAAADDERPGGPEPVTPPVVDARDAARLSFRDAKFGLSIHWGVSSLLGKGEWVMERDRLPVSEYEKLPPRFNPTGFDAEAWVKTAKGAGAKYLAVAAKGP